jgi:ABC-type polysaccharide/polyol phosphate export permease
MTFWRWVSSLSFITTALCYARARFGEAEVWRDLAHREIASRFQTMSLGPMAIGPNTIEGDYRN